MSKENSFLNNILDEEFLGILAKSAELYKIGSNSTLDPEEIRIGLKVVPRAVMSMLISELGQMEVNSHKDINLPFGIDAYIRVNKNAADDYTGSIYSNKKLVYDFMNRSIPGLGIILLSTFELYNLEELSQKDETAQPNDVDKKIQKLIDERMELHSLVGRVVEHKMAEREAVHKLMMSKLHTLMINPTSITKMAESTANPSVTGTPVIPSVPGTANPPIGSINIEAKDIVKKEAPAKKGSPLKEFMARKNKPKEYHVEISKSEIVDCGDCGKTIFGKSGYSGCICLGENMDSKIWIKKSEDGVQIKFSKSWSADNIEMLLETLRAKK